MASPAARMATILRLVGLAATPTETRRSGGWAPRGRCGLKGAATPSAMLLEPHSLLTLVPHAATLLAPRSICLARGGGSMAHGSFPRRLGRRFAPFLVVAAVALALQMATAPLALATITNLTVNRVVPLSAGGFI